jgi:hypothetical protein
MSPHTDSLKKEPTNIESKGEKEEATQNSNKLPTIDRQPLVNFY